MTGCGGGGGGCCGIGEVGSIKAAMTGCGGGGGGCCGIGEVGSTGMAFAVKTKEQERSDNVKIERAVIIVSYSSA